MVFNAVVISHPQLSVTKRPEMNSLILLLIVELLILIVPSLFFFRSRHEFVNCLYSFLFVESFSHIKSVYKKHTGRSVKFALYLVLVLFASLINITFRDALIKMEFIDDSILSALKLEDGYSNFFFFRFLFL